MKKKKERKKHSLLESSHLLHFRFDVAEGGRGDSRETTLNFQVNRSSWRAKLLLLPIKGMISGAWTRVLRTVFFLFFSFSFLKLLVSTRREARREKGGEFIRGAACSSLCQQRQRELISFSLAEKAAQRRSKREPRGSNELREIHREIM